MMCGNCEKHAVESVKKAVSTKSVVASHVEKKVEVTVNSPVDVSVIKDAIEDRGYTVTDVKEEKVEKKGLFSFLKK